MTQNDGGATQVEEAPEVATSTDDGRLHSGRDGHLPTDSMISVRLSDSSGTVALDTVAPEKVEDSRVSATNSVRKSIRFSTPPTVEESVIEVQDDLPATEEQADMPEDHHVRASKITVDSIREDDSTLSRHSTNRSRSDSSGTLSSNDSAQVDWDELDRSEEQAPRDEGSDEVGKTPLGVREANLHVRPPHSCWQG